MSAHAGQVITYENLFNNTPELAPGLEKLTADSPLPLAPLPDGTYPIRQPGIISYRQY